MDLYSAIYLHIASSLQHARTIWYTYKDFATNIFKANILKSIHQKWMLPKYNSLLDIDNALYMTWNTHPLLDIPMKNHKKFVGNHQNYKVQTKFYKYFNGMLMTLIFLIYCVDSGVVLPNTIFCILVSLLVCTSNTAQLAICNFCERCW